MTPTTASASPLGLADMQNLSVQGLREELAKSIAITAHSIAYLANVWRELERRGEDLSDIKSGLISYLPMVAAGRLQPEAVVHFAGRAMLLKRISALPPQQQLALANGERIPVVIEQDGELVEQQLQADEIPSQLLAQVFTDGGVRPVTEQQLLAAVKVAVKGKKKTKKSAAGRPVKIQIDMAKNLMMAGKAELRLSDVIAAMRQAGLSVTDRP